MIDIYFDGKAACLHGLTAPTPLAELEEIAKRDRFLITIDLNIARGEYCVLSADLSPEYVDFNRSEYAASRHAAGKAVEVG